MITNPHHIRVPAPAVPPFAPLTPTLPRRFLPRVRTGFCGGDAGMSTAEYAIGTIAAAAFAGVLYAVVTGDSVIGALTGIVERALSVNF